MVDVPAEVHSLDPAQPVKFDWFTRADRALRRMPGFGVALTAMYLEYQYSQGRIFLFVLLSAGVAGVLLLEFWRNPNVTTGSSPKLSAGPYAPRQRPDPTSAS